MQSATETDIRAVGGSAIRQSAPATAVPTTSPIGATGQSTGRVSTQTSASKILLVDAEAAGLMGISVRKFHELRPLLSPNPAVVLGPRCVRYVRSELEAAIANLPRQSLSEPAQLARVRIDRMKRGGSLAQVGA